MQQFVRLVFLDALQIAESPCQLDCLLDFSVLLVISAKVEQALSQLFVIRVLFFFSSQVQLKGVHCLLLVFWAHRMVKLAHLMDGDTLSVLTVLCPHVTTLRFVGFAHFFVAAAHRIPHSGVLGP